MIVALSLSTVVLTLISYSSTGALSSLDSSSSLTSSAAGGGTSSFLDPKSGNQDGFSSPSSLRKPKARDVLGANAGRVWATCTKARDDATSKSVAIKIRRENMLLVENG